MEDRVGGGDAVRRRIERQVTVDRRLESRVDAYGTLLTGARGGTSPGCILPPEFLGWLASRAASNALRIWGCTVLFISTKKASVVI